MQKEKVGETEALIGGWGTSWALGPTTAGSETSDAASEGE